MEIGIPAEPDQNEYRVGMTPQGVYLLTQAGHRCYVEQGAGEGAGFLDTDYERAGGRIVYGAREVYQRADLVLRVGCPQTHEELDMLREEQTICTFWHMAARRREVAQTLIDRRITAVAYETIERDDGVLPVLRPLSEIAGRMAPQVAARWLQNDGGGRGILISGIAGIPPIDVCILGGGVVGFNAARAFLGLGARVFVLDRDLPRLEEIERYFEGRVVTMVAYDFNIARVLSFAHVVIGAVLVPGMRAPVIVTREMVRSMRPRSVIMDISIDQGGCVETSRLMSHADPIFVEEDVIHYCVPNMSGVVARTATHAYLNAAWPYIQKLASEGTQTAIDHDPALMRGVMIHDGQVVNENLTTLLMGA
jgi:alanine dehydrogenase